jgi:hypothetical protein
LNAWALELEEKAIAQIQSRGGSIGDDLQRGFPALLRCEEMSRTATCGRFWRRDTDNRQRLHYLAVILVWPLLWPL